MLANLLQDVRYALHGFALRPMFAAAVVLTLAVGIGVNVAVFSLYDQIMLRELPVSRPAELVNLVSPGPRVGNDLCNSQGGCDETFSYPLFRDLEAVGEPALLIGELASALLYGLAPTDPRAVAAAAVVMAVTVLGASYRPARRASRVDPVVALRAE
jgi:ABC-type antimicrobial peptide transport system permease subunit